MDDLEIVDCVDDVRKISSNFYGHDTFIIDKNDIAALLQGKRLVGVINDKYTFDLKMEE